jgi:hypothetical protein
MKKAIAFVLLAAAGVVALVQGAGGFYGSGDREDRRAVVAQEPEIAPDVDVMQIPAIGEDSPQARMLFGSEQSGANLRATVPLSWTDELSGERFEFPHFLAWTLIADDVRPNVDPTTGAQGFNYEHIRIVLYRKPQTRAEAEALRDDPVRNRLVRYEIDAERGSGTWNLRAGIRPDRPLIRLTRSATLRDPGRELTVLCNDALVDLDSQTAEGSGDLAAEHPACSLRGRGFRLGERGARFEIFQDADVRVHAQPAGGGSPDGGLGGGSMRPSRLRAAGGAVVTALPPAEGRGYRVVIERGVEVEQTDGPTLDADSAEIVVLEAPKDEAPAGRTGAYRLRSFVGEGHVRVTRRDDSAGYPSLLSVFCDRLVHDATARGPGKTLLEGACRATYRGDFSTSDGRKGYGLVRLSSRRSMSIGPPAEDHSDAELQLTFDGGAVVERTAATGDEAPDRLEADRIVLFLASARRGGALPPGASGPFDSNPSDLVATEFSARGAVRIDGPRVVGNADSIVGLHLDRPEFQLIADGNPLFDVASAAAGGRPAGTSGSREAAPGSASAAGGGAAAGDKGPRPEWRLDSLRATGDVTATLRMGGGPMRLDGDTLVFDERTGAVLERRSGGVASIQVGDEGEGNRIEAPSITFDPVQGALSTNGGRTHARVQVGETQASRARTDAPDRVVVRAGGRIQVDGVHAPGVQYRIRIDGGGAIETVGSGGVVDRLRADEIEAAIGEGPAASPLFGTSPGVAKSAPAAGAGPTSAVGNRPAAPWTLDCGALEVRFAAAGAGGVGDLRSLDAVGGVVASTAGTRIEGERLRFDAAKDEIRIEGTPAESARLRSGEGAEAQRAWSPTIVVATRDGTPVGATLSAPSTVLISRGLEQTKVERVELRASAELAITSSGAETRGRTALTRRVREGTGAWSAPSTLWTPHLRVEADHLLGGGKAEMRRVVARGDGTRFESGDPGKDGFSAAGETIVYDAVAQKVVIESTRGRVSVVSGGGQPFETTGRSVTYDLKTGLPDFEGSRITIPGK